MPTMERQEGDSAEKLQHQKQAGANTTAEGKKEEEEKKKKEAKEKKDEEKKDEEEEKKGEEETIEETTREEGATKNVDHQTKQSRVDTEQTATQGETTQDAQLRTLEKSQAPIQESNEKFSEPPDSQLEMQQINPATSTEQQDKGI